MTTETTCLSSIWETDEETQGFYAAHQRPEDYAPLHPAKVAYYDRMIAIDLSKIESMIALPFHPSNAWTIHEFLENAQELLAKVEADAAKRFPKTHPHLTDKIHDGGVWADQGVIAGCAGGLFDNITEAADILKGGSTGNGAFTLDVYPTSVPVSLELTRDGVTADLLTTGDAAYSMENYATAETAQKADTDPEGCFAVAVAADNSATGARVVWVNCPNLLESNINQAVSGGNAQFLGSVVNWMNGEQTTAVINAKSMSAASLSVPTSAAIPLGVLFTLVLPIVCIIAGAVVCVVRRRR